jgi:hypothetical protein
MTLSSSDAVNALHAAGIAPPDDEQRTEGRVQTVYRPCCLRAGPHCGVGLIRNVSHGGMMVETEIDAPLGSEIDYFQETAQWRRARVIWRDGDRVGLQNIDEAVPESPGFPYRALRIPTTLVGRMWIRQHAIEVGIGNISHKGVLAFGVPPIEPNLLVTLSIAGREFANTSMRWWADGSAGLQFAQPMTLRGLSELIEVAGRRASSLYYERRISELLEVVPANDPQG